MLWRLPLMDTGRVTLSDGERFRDVVAGLVYRDDHVLLCHRHPERRWYPNVGHVPGGHVEPHEDPLRALHRGLREELGIAIATLGETADLHLRDGDLRLKAWVIHRWEGEPANLIPDEHDRTARYSSADLRTLRLAHRRYVDFIERALHPGPLLAALDPALPNTPVDGERDEPW